VLDLGCGVGRDCFALSYLVGEKGYVIGVDMTREQIAIAGSFVNYHTEKFGYSQPNVEFLYGYIENLHDLGLQDNSFDIVVSNCVINLSPDKESVLRETYRVLKPGGEIYFSDIYAAQRVPLKLLNNFVLYGECLAGALYWNDFLRLAKKQRFLDPRLVEDSLLSINNKEIESLLGFIRFFKATYRLFKLEDLESACEDYGQAVIYNGDIKSSPNGYKLDSHHFFPTGKVVLVCGNTFSMLKNTRFASFFSFIGDNSTHYGIFEGCGVGLPFSGDKSSKGTSCC